MSEPPLVKLLGGIHPNIDGFWRKKCWDFELKVVLFFFQKKLLAQIEKSLYLQVPKELGAHTLCVDSTHQYFESWEYELLTPSELGDRVIFLFGLVVFLEKILQLLAQNLNIFPPKSIYIWRNLP